MNEPTSIRLPFFATTAATTNLQRIADTWKGTPFHPHAALRGVGVDCVNLCAQIYIECGVIKDFFPPAYTMSEGAHLQQSKILDYLSRRPEFVPLTVPARDPKARSPLACCGEEPVSTAVAWMPGDFLCFRIGKVAHHCGLVVNSREFIHVYKGAATACNRMDDPTYQNNLMHAFRPML